MTWELSTRNLFAEKLVTTEMNDLHANVSHKNISHGQYLKKKYFTKNFKRQVFYRERDITHQELVMDLIILHEKFISCLKNKTSELF